MGFKDERKADSSRAVFVDHAYDLFQILLKPVLSSSEFKSEKVLIIPDGVMGYLPFDILLSRKPDSSEFFRSFDYLLKDYIIRYETTVGYSI